MKKRILLTGGSGFLGGNFCQLYSSHFQVHTTYNNNFIDFEGVTAHKVDLSNRQNIEELINEISPEIIIHLAAVSDPNKCQLDPQNSYLQNVTVTSHLAHIAALQKMPFVFASTDLVFDGENAPYSESDNPKPVNIYGRHKAEAEQVVVQIYPKALICRLPLMYGNSYSAGQSFLQPVLQKLSNNQNVHLFTDEYRTVASARDVCAGILSLIEKGENGIYHLSGNESLSRFEMGEIICSIYGYDKKCLVPSLQKDVKMPAPRPKNVSMNNAKARKIGWSPGKFADELKKLDA